MHGVQHRRDDWLCDARVRIAGYEEAPAIGTGAPNAPKLAGSGALRKILLPPVSQRANAHPQLVGYLLEATLDGPLREGTLGGGLTFGFSELDFLECHCVILLGIHEALKRTTTGNARQAQPSAGLVRFGKTPAEPVSARKECSTAKSS